MAKKKRIKSGNPAANAVLQSPEIKPFQGNNAVVSSQSSSTSGFFGSAYFEWIVIAIASAISYWILTARLVGVNVSVLIDEYSYVLDSHYRELTEAYYPNHLFQLVFSVTKQCGADFYSCARSLNAVFVIAGAIFIYLLAKHISGKKWLGALGAIAAVLGSYGTYTAYFMPEALFNFLMIVFFWAFIRFGSSKNLLTWSAFGFALGMASLAKPHALFVLPAIVVFILLWTRATKKRFFVNAATRVASFSLGLFATKFGVGYILAGEKGLSFFGSYGGAISSGEAIASTFGKTTWEDLPGTAWGQTLMVTMIIGVALPVIFVGLLDFIKQDPEVSQAVRFRALLALSFLNMIAVSAAFEAWQNLNYWMHTRYYSYLIPLAVVALIEAYSRAENKPSPIVKKIVVGVFLIPAVIALFTNGVPFNANWIDSPDFKLHVDNLVFSSIAVLFAIGLATWWLWENKKPILLAVIFAVLASTFSGMHITNYLSEKFGQDTIYDQLGRVLRDYLPQDELDRTILVGESAIAMERALFGSLSGSASALLSSSEDFELAKLPSSTLWVVATGEQFTEKIPGLRLSGSGYSLHYLGNDSSMAPRNSDLSSFTNQCEGTAFSDWSCGDNTDIQIVSHFPANSNFEVYLEVSEFAALGELEFELGNSKLVGKIPAGVNVFTLNFNNSEPESQLSIRQVQPTISLDQKFIRPISIVLVR